MARLIFSRQIYNPEISKVPELIGKHPGVIAPVTLYKKNPLEFVKPASASRVSDIMEVEVKIRGDNEEFEKNLRKVVLTIDGNRFKFDKPPYKVRNSIHPMPGNDHPQSRGPWKER